MGTCKLILAPELTTDGYPLCYVLKQGPSLTKIWSIKKINNSLRYSRCEFHLKVITCLLNLSSG